MKRNKIIKKTVGIGLVGAIVISAAGGGVYYIQNNTGTVVETIPVSQLDASEWISWGSDEGTYGTVASDVTQNVRIPDDKVLEEVFVKQGDTVKVGDKLLCYDTTLLELDQELQQLTVEKYDIELTAALKDLEKLKNTTPVAKSNSDDAEYDDTYSSNEALLDSLESQYGGDDEASLITNERNYLAQAEDMEVMDGDMTLEEEEEPAFEIDADMVLDTAPENGNEAEQIMGEETEDVLLSQEGVASQDASVQWAAEQQVDSFFGESVGSSVQESMPKTDQSLRAFFSNIRVKAVTKEGEVLLADTAQDMVEARIEGNIILIPHFCEGSEKQFASQDTYACMISGLNLQENITGMVYGIAAQNGEDYPEIGGFTLVQVGENLAKLMIAFHDGLDKQHEVDPALQDMYLEIPLSMQDVNTGELVFLQGEDCEKPRSLLLMKEEVQESEPETEAKSEPETESKSETEPETETESKSEPETEPETESKSEPETESKSEPETEPETEPKSEPETEPETEAKSEPESESKPETESEPESEIIIEAETESKEETDQVNESENPDSNALQQQVVEESEDYTLINAVYAEGTTEDTAEEDTQDQSEEVLGEDDAEQSEEFIESESTEAVDRFFGTNTEETLTSIADETEAETTEDVTAKETEAAAAPIADETEAGTMEDVTIEETEEATVEETQEATEDETGEIVEEDLNDDTEASTEEETEEITEESSEAEDVEVISDEVKFKVIWNHGTNHEMRWPEALKIYFYKDMDSDAEWAFSLSENGKVSSDQASGTPGEEEVSEDALIQETEASSEETIGDTTGALEDNADTEDGVEEWDTISLRWPRNSSFPVGDEAKTWVYAENYLGTAAYDVAANTYTIIMTYQEPVESPLAIFTPISLLTYENGMNTMEGTGLRAYKGNGTSEDPYVFLVTDGVKIEASFVNWVMGFNADGTERLTDGYVVKLEIRESDNMSGAFLRAVEFDGTILREYGYAPSTYWTFTSENGIEVFQEEIPEDEEPFIDPNGGGGGGWSDTGDSYTAEELAEAIREKELEIRSLKLDKKEAELKLNKYNRELEASTVVSAVNGTVTTVGGDDAYMVINSSSGLYIKTTISELELDNVSIDDVLSCQSWDTGATFSATVTQIDTLPSGNSNDSYYYAGTSSNSTSYPVLAMVDPDVELEEHEYVNVKFPNSQAGSGSIYLEKAYIRSENGKSYVMVVGSDGKLKKRYVRTGGNSYGYIEILEGLSRNDYITFPYNKNAKEGTATKLSSEYAD